MQEVEQRRSSCRGAPGISFAQCFKFSMGAKVMWSLFQDMPRAHPCGRGLMFRMNGMPRAQGFAGAACVNFAQCFLISMGPHPLGSVGKLNTVVSDRRVERGINLRWDGICQKPLHCDYAQRRGWEVPFFRTVRDRKSSSSVQGRIYSESERKVPRDLGAHAD